MIVERAARLLSRLVFKQASRLLYEREGNLYHYHAFCAVACRPLLLYNVRFPNSDKNESQTVIETATLEEATVEKLTEAAVIMTAGWGDPQAPKVLVGRQEFVRAGANAEIAKETAVLRVKITSDEEFEELKSRVKEAKGDLDPGEE